MNISKFFGEEVEERLEEPPRGTSEYVEDFYRNLDECYQKGEPFIYILDSMDVLNSLADVKQEQKAKRAVDAGKEAGGSYALAKPKLNSAGLRKARAYLKKTGSILIIIAQTRDNIGFGSQFNPKTRSGGHALRFYNRLELWTSPLKELTKDRSVGTKKKKIQQGVLVRVKIKKNHVTGERHSVEVPIYHSYGIDDIGACVDYLVEEGVWKKKGGSINAHHFDLNARRASIIRHVEEESLESKLRKIVRSTWKEVNEQGKLDRKPRYS